MGNSPRFGPVWRPCPHAASHEIIDVEDPDSDLLLCEAHWQSLQAYTADLDRPFVDSADEVDR